jgi:hypothetical protein
MKSRGHHHHHYEYVFAHSMGGLLVSKYLRDHHQHEENKLNKPKFILMMPFLSRIPLHDILINALGPLAEPLVLPLPFAIPSGSLNGNGNPWQDWTPKKTRKVSATSTIPGDMCWWVPMKQIVQCYLSDDIFPSSPEQAVALLNNKNIDVNLVYASDDILAPLDPYIVKNVISSRIWKLQGGHTCFNDFNYAQTCIQTLEQVIVIGLPAIIATHPPVIIFPAETDNNNNNNNNNEAY